MDHCLNGQMGEDDGSHVWHILLKYALHSIGYDDPCDGITMKQGYRTLLRIEREVVTQTGENLKELIGRARLCAKWLLKGKRESKKLTIPKIINLARLGPLRESVTDPDDWTPIEENKSLDWTDYYKLHGKKTEGGVYTGQDRSFPPYVPLDILVTWVTGKLSVVELFGAFFPAIFAIILCTLNTMVTSKCYNRHSNEHMIEIMRDRWTSLYNIRLFAVAGSSRSGKTTACSVLGMRCLERISEVTEDIQIDRMGRSCVYIMDTPALDHNDTTLRRLVRIALHTADSVILNVQMKAMDAVIDIYPDLCDIKRKYVILSRVDRRWAAIITDHESEKMKHSEVILIRGNNNASVDVDLVPGQGGYDCDFAVSQFNATRPRFKANVQSIVRRIIYMMPNVQVYLGCWNPTELMTCKMVSKWDKLPSELGGVTSLMDWEGLSVGELGNEHSILMARGLTALSCKILRDVGVSDKEIERAFYRCNKRNDEKPTKECIAPRWVRRSHASLYRARIMWY